LRISQKNIIFHQMSVPHQLSYFELQEEIGRGGMGSVWRAKDPTLDREVAIKVLRDERASDPKFVADFLQEARNAAAISHPNIAQVHLVGETGGQYYIVMELLYGHSLRQILETEGQLDEERALDIAIQVAVALRAAYKQRMIHGDIKPANIFITEDQGAKVLDFGLAKLANVEVTDTGGGIWGSPYYISPERVGQKAEDFRSDVYSLGATLFHALTGRPPFDAEDPAQLALKRLNEKPPLLRDINPKITIKTEQVVNKMLNKSILMRYLDYDALLKDLGEAKTEATAKRLGIDLHAMDHPQPPAPVVTPPPFKKSAMPIIIGVSIGIVAIAAAVGMVLWQNSHRGPTPPIPIPGPDTHTQATTPSQPKILLKPVATTTSQVVVAHWQLNENGDDASGNGYMLSFIADPAFAPGYSDQQALLLNGAGQCAQTAGPVLDTSRPFSVAAWVYWTGGSGCCPTILSQDGVNISSFWLQRGGDGMFCVVMRDGDSTTSSKEGRIEAVIPAASTWYHLVGVYTGSEIRLYVNGTLKGTALFKGCFASSGPMVIGAGKWETRKDFWGGMIEEVNAFNYAISDADVAALAAIPPPPPPPRFAPHKVAAGKH
jgi:serine/threonine protein kinase